MAVLVNVTGNPGWPLVGLATFLLAHDGWIDGAESEKCFLLRWLAAVYLHGLAGDVAREFMANIR